MTNGVIETLPSERLSTLDKTAEILLKLSSPRGDLSLLKLLVSSFEILVLLSEDGDSRGTGSMGELLHSEYLEERKR
jgi:hypothetical protein